MHLQKQLRAPHSILASSNSKHPFGSYLRKRSETIRKVPLGLGLLFGPFASLCFPRRTHVWPTWTCLLRFTVQDGQKNIQRSSRLDRHVCPYLSIYCPACFFLSFLFKKIKDYVLYSKKMVSCWIRADCDSVRLELLLHLADLLITYYLFPAAGLVRFRS